MYSGQSLKYSLAAKMMVRISCPSLIYHYGIYWTDTPLRFTAKIFCLFYIKRTANTPPTHWVVPWKVGVVGSDPHSKNKDELHIQCTCQCWFGKSLSCIFWYILEKAMHGT